MTVDGTYGKTEVSPMDEPDLGSGGTVAVITFDGVVDYGGEAYMSPLRLGDSKVGEVSDSIVSRVSDAELVRL